MDRRKVAIKPRPKKIQIRHVLKDGTALKDITGHQITRKDNPRVYEILERMNERRKKDGNNIRGNQKSK